MECMRTTIVCLLALGVIAAPGAGCTDNSGAGDAGPPDRGSHEGLGFVDGGSSPPPADSSIPGDKKCLKPDDCDADGLTNAEEKKLGLDPYSADSDSDGKGDKDEVADVNQPTDSDGDGKIDAKEPANFDSDGDGTFDEQDKTSDGPCATTKKLFDRETLNQDLTLGAACSPYLVLGHLRIAGGATLTVAAGAEVRFGNGAALLLGGTGSSPTKGSLHLAGAKNKQGVPVEARLTAHSLSPTPGFWRGVVAGAADTITASHATVAYAGAPTLGADPRAAVLVKAASGLSFDHTTIRNCVGVGLHAAFKVSGAGKLFTTFKDNTIKDLDDAPGTTAAAAALHIAHLGELDAGNDLGSQSAGSAGKLVQVSGTTVDAPALWPDIGVPYQFLESSINVDDALVLAPGVTLVLPGGQGAELAVGSSPGTKGNLTAKGAPGKTIVLRTKSGAKGSWQGLKLMSGDANKLDQVEVVGGGASGSSSGGEACIYVGPYASVTMAGVTVKECAKYGVQYYFGSTSTPCSSVPIKAFSFSGIGHKCHLYCQDAYGSSCLVP